MKLVFVHGWGFDRTLWQGLRDALPEFETDAADLGFFGRPRAAEANGEAVIAVGHSLGLLWLLHERPFPWRALVSISGMPRFTKGPDYRFGTGARVLDAMIARFEKEPAATLEDFFGYCGLNVAPAPNADTERLYEGLLWLKSWDARDQLAAERVPVLALYSQDDAVVPEHLSADLFANRPGTSHAVTEAGGHVLPLTRMDWCAENIRAFARGLA